MVRSIFVTHVTQKLNKVTFLNCQAVINNMYVDDTPVELASLEKLDQILMAQRIVFVKIIVMPKGQQRKVKGAICNVMVECDQTSSLLPRPPERDLV